MSRIGIDLDGVCYDFAGSFREYLHIKRLRMQHECPDAQRWEFYEDWGFTLAEFLDLCHRGVESRVIFTYGEPYPGTREGLLALKAAGHTLHVITDRSFGRGGASERATRAWLDEHGLPFDSLTFSPDKTIVRTDYMIDDKLSNYDQLNDAGSKVYLFDRPWNQTSDRDARRRVNTMAEFVDEVLA